MTKILRGKSGVSGVATAGVCCGKDGVPTVALSVRVAAVGASVETGASVGAPVEAGASVGASVETGTSVAADDVRLKNKAEYKKKTGFLKLSFCGLKPCFSPSTCPCYHTIWPKYTLMSPSHEGV